MKTLVVVYSRTGTTEAIGRKVADALGADFEALREPKERRGFGGFMRSAFEAFRKRRAKLDEPTHNPADFDVVIVGTPVWAGRMSSPVRTYLTRFRGVFRRVAFFCTSDSGQVKTALAGMEEAAGIPPLSTLGVTRGQVKERVDGPLIESFVAAIRRAGGVSAPTEET